MRRTLRWSLVTVVVLGALAYLGAAFWLRANEKRFVYRPDIGPPDQQTVSAPHTWQRVTVTAADGVSLVGVVLPAEDPGSPWLLEFHGSGGNVGGRLRSRGYYDGFHAMGLNVLSVDYRGYGESDPRPPDEAGLYADALGCYDWLVRTRQVPPERVIVYGHSLGSGPATELVTRVPAAALVLEGAFTAVADRGAELYWWLPVRWITTQRFANVEKVGRISIPKLLMHAVDDELIPYAQGRRLFAAAREPKQWADLTGGHNDARRGAAWRSALGRFLRGLQLHPVETSVSEPSVGSYARLASQPK